MFLVPFRAKREENFEGYLRATGAKKMKISKPYFQISVNFENPQNPSCMIWKSILKNLKSLNLEVAGGDLKGGG